MKKYIVIIPHQLPPRVLVEYTPLVAKYNRRTKEGEKFIGDKHYFRVFNSLKKLKAFQLSYDKANGHQSADVCDRIERVIRFGNQFAPNH